MSDTTASSEAVLTLTHEQLVTIIEDELHEHRVVAGVGLCCGTWHQYGGSPGTKTPRRHLAEALATRIELRTSSSQST